MRKVIVEIKVKEEFSNIIIPKIALPIQEKIKEYISKNYNNRIKGRYLIEIVKQSVELSIEQNEQIAEKWINTEINKLGVNL